MQTEELQELEADIARAYKEHGCDRIELNIDLVTAMTVVGAIQLAMRHPAFFGPTRAVTIRRGTDTTVVRD